MSGNEINEVLGEVRLSSFPSTEIRYELEQHNTCLLLSEYTVFENYRKSIIYKFVLLDVPYRRLNQST